MTDTDVLYNEIKPDLELVAKPLFELSEVLLRNLGNFLPHAAVLTDHNEVKLVGVDQSGSTGSTASLAVLPLLHQGLRQQAKELSLKAIGIAENVTVTPQGQKTTKAIKVLIEHRRGLTVALYLPFEKKLFRGYITGPVFSMLAVPDVDAWSSASA